MTPTHAITYEHAIPDILQAMANVHGVIAAHGLDPSLCHLVRLRASQINRCGYCVKMHTRDARRDGETADRLDRVIVWNHVSDFTEQEQVALEWTEALTQMDARTDLGTLRARLRDHFSDAEIGALTAEIAMINLWNRINVSKH
ncbi:carboxymuconolactone decarboxylase family protein [uncultured Tateyamaria sp.]|uniref:carboxymuconolactone decarboxylase family protein n=1 Tax=Tateyamaria sp. 1078 TaxID=3417464 RepID=UPI00261B46A7|nr:carboxymuconolactone decarboxylase family protein [uncultured Tateyamaria sp.]